MSSITSAMSWLLLFFAVLLAVLGVISVRLPATGLVLAPVLLWVGLRHRLVGAQLLWSALTGVLPIESAPAACEVIQDAQRSSVAAGVVGSMLVLLLGGPNPEVLAPACVSAGLVVTLWRPLTRRLQSEYGRWNTGLKEALMPVSSHEELCLRQLA